MNEADEQFASRLADDLARYLGPQIRLADLDLGDVHAELARVRATCVFEREIAVLEAHGDTRLEAYHELTLRAAELRLTVAMRHKDEDAIIGFAAAWHAGLSPEHRQ